MLREVRHGCGPTSPEQDLRSAAGRGSRALAVSACIHLALYLTGYRSIPTIGWLFLLQVVVGFALVAGALATHSRLAAAAGAAFALSTLGCYLLAVWTGLFGFKEIRTRAVRTGQVKGSNTWTPASSKSLTLRVTTVMPCTRAVAAMSASITGRGCAYC